MDKQRTEQLDPIKAIRMAGRAKGEDSKAAGLPAGITFICDC
jgi:hypothetical protein